MSDLAEKWIGAVKDEESVEKMQEAFFEFCVYLDTEKGLGDRQFAIAYNAALERRRKSYEEGCALLSVVRQR
jgi:hypothetical protein